MTRNYKRKEGAKAPGRKPLDKEPAALAQFHITADQKKQDLEEVIKSGARSLAELYRRMRGDYYARNK